MTPPTFRIGDEVIITGQPCGLSGYCIGGKGTVKDINGAGNYYVNVWWYPASSLRLVGEGLKIGDLVEVIGHPKGVPCYENISRVGRIDDIGATKGRRVFGYFYEPAALRKLTPEEIRQYQKSQFTVTATLDTSKFVAGIEKVQDKIWKACIEERLSTIEHRQGTQPNRMDEIEKRIDFIEAFQKHATYTTYTYNPDDSEHGTITVHCSCGQKHEIEATPRAYQVDSEAVQKDEVPEAIDSKKSYMDHFRESMQEPCHRDPTRNCALRNVVNRMDCAICEEVAHKALDGMRKED